MALFAHIITYPPLAQVTVVPPMRKELNFTVTLASSKSLPDRPWEVSIWYDYGSYSGQKAPWQALDLRPVTQNLSLMYDDTDSQNYHYTFSANLPSPFTTSDKIYKGRRVPFTVRYRIDSNSEWMWVYHNFGTGDGELILQPPIDPNFLTASPVDLKDGWFTRKLNSEAPEARLYSIESAAPIPASEDGDATVQKKVLGRVLQACRWFALVRIWAPWLAPRHGEHRLHLSEPAILLSFLRLDGLHVVVLAVNGIDDVLTTFGSTPEGDIVVESRNDSGKDRNFRLLAATAWKFEVANAAVMYEARKLVRQSAAYIDTAESLPKEIRTLSVDSDAVLVTNGVQGPSAPSPQWLEFWSDGLAYCTWNSLGQDLNADKLMAALDSFAKNKIHISSLIIDDNWQSLSGVQGQNQFERGWAAFEANPLGFPDGLKSTITRIRECHPSIHDIAVWHALMGYWGGISPTGEIASNYKTRKVLIREGSPASGTKVAVDPTDIHRMYDDFYAFLSASGVTAVKTDVQFMLDELASTQDRRDFTTTYQLAWTQAHLKHLAGRAISCMSMTPQILHHSFLPTNTPRVTLRNSDDFFPDVPSSHAWHVFTNAHNALFTQHLNVLPDWDMFQTSHPFSAFHAASRCLSGGPVYITDTPGEHDVDLIHQMTALNPRGQTVVLRPSNVGKSVSVYDKYEDKGVLKIGVFDGKANVGTGMLGVFNLAEQDVVFVLPLAKFPGATSPEEWKDGIQRSWIVRSHVSGKITAPMVPGIPMRPGNLLKGKLGPRGCDIWSAVPVREVELSTADGSEAMLTRVAVLGLLGKMTGACAIVESKFSLAGNGRRLKVHVQLKAMGRLGIWVSDARKRSVDDLMVSLQGKPVPKHTVQISSEPEGADGKDEAGVVEVDVQTAWEEMSLQPGWSNEVGVEVLIG